MIGEEWRPVVDFPMYEMTRSGRFRYKYDPDIEITSGNGNITLRRGNARYYRSVRKLIRETFDRREVPVLVAEGFKPIPDFPGYSISRKGQIFNERLRTFLHVDETQHTVKLVVDGVRYHKSVRQLVRMTFG